MMVMIRAATFGAVAAVAWGAVSAQAADATPRPHHAFYVRDAGSASLADRESPSTEHTAVARTREPRPHHPTY